MNKVSQSLPSLEHVLNEIGSLCESAEVKFEDAPHIIEILLPTICSYLNYWWYYGPSAKQINDAKSAKRKQLENTQSVDSEKVPTQATAAPTSKTPALAAPGSAATGDKFEGYYKHII